MQPQTQQAPAGQLTAMVRKIKPLKIRLLMIHADNKKGVATAVLFLPSRGVCLMFFRRAAGFYLLWLQLIAGVQHR